jgi:hypothetical protein
MLLTSAKEGNTYVITYSFIDETGVTMTPFLANWSLRNNLGAIVNNRSVVSIVTPATSGTIILTKDDLIYEENSSTFRTFTLSAVYNGNYGSVSTVIEEAQFNIEPLIGI